MSNIVACVRKSPGKCSRVSFRQASTDSCATNKRRLQAQSAASMIRAENACTAVRNTKESCYVDTVDEGPPHGSGAEMMAMDRTPRRQAAVVESFEIAGAIQDCRILKNRSPCRGRLVALLRT